MLWDSSVIRAYEIESADDGTVGGIADLLIETRGWNVRWVIVELGSWITPRQILLPQSLIRQPSPGTNCIPVRVAKAKLLASPRISTDLPVTPRFIRRMYDYYALNPLYESPLLSEAVLGMREGLSPSAMALSPREAVKVRDKSEDALRSVKALNGFGVKATDGGIGTIEGFIVDDAGWLVRYLVIRHKTWWRDKHVVLPPFSVNEIDDKKHLVRVDVSMRKIKGGPSYSAHAPLTRVWEQEFFSYYGWMGYWL